MKKEIFEAFANPIRLQILCCLANQEKNVQEIISTCGLSQSAISQHLQKLRVAGFVNTHREGKFVYYSLTHPESAKLAQAIKEFLEKMS